MTLGLVAVLVTKLPVPKRSAHVLLGAGVVLLPPPPPHAPRPQAMINKTIGRSVCIGNLTEKMLIPDSSACSEFCCEHRHARREDQAR